MFENVIKELGIVRILENIEINSIKIYYIK